MQLNDKDRRIIRNVTSFWRIHGSGPTYEEISTAVGQTVPAVYKRVKKLSKYGLLSRTSEHRSVIPTVLGREWVQGRLSTNIVKRKIYEEQ